MRHAQAGSATVITDETGTEIRRLAYRAFGEEAENVGTGNEPKYSYTGKERDKSGLMYYGARYYDPALARFITADTVYDRGPQGLNRYSYVLNNPIRYNDPSGHVKEVPRPEDPHHTYRTKEYRAKTLNSLSNGMEDGEEISLTTLGEDNPDALAALNVALGGKAHKGCSKENTVDPLMNARTATGTDGDMTMLTKDDIAMVVARDKERPGWMITASENDIDVGIFGLGVAAGGMIRANQPSTSGASGRTTQDFLEEVWRRADSKVSGSGSAAGTQKHSYAERLINRYQRRFGPVGQGLSTEQSYVGGSHLGRSVNVRGSVRLDVVEGSVTSPSAIYDFKFTRNPNPTLSPARINQIRSQAGLRPTVPIEVIRP